MKQTSHIFILLAVALLCSCSATKFVPDGKYLLDEVSIKSDNKDFNAKQLKPYIRQKSNSKLFWLNRLLQKKGNQPVVFDSLLAQQSCNDLAKAMQNRGYMRAYVTMETQNLHSASGRTLLHQQLPIRHSGYGCCNIITTHTENTSGINTLHRCRTGQRAQAHHEIPKRQRLLSL